MDLRTVRRVGPVAAVGALLLAAMVAADLATPQVRQVPVPFAPPTVRPPSLPAFHAIGAPPVGGSAATGPGRFSWIGTVLQYLCVGLVAALAAVLLITMLRSALADRKEKPPVEDEPATAPTRREDVLAAVNAGLSDLDDNDQDPRRAVIACWVRLEQAAAAAGTPRQPGDSPTDLVVRLLAAHQVSAGVLYPLADVYRLARYATHTVDMTMREAARSALRQVRAELTGIQVP